MTATLTISGHGARQLRDIDRHCEICSSAQATLVRQYTTTPWPLVECDDCGFVYLGAVPPYSALGHDLAWEVTSSAEKRRRAKLRFDWVDTATRWRTRIGRRIDVYRRQRTLGFSGNVLDVGCGGGCRVPEGPTPYGIEISAALAQRAAPAFALRSGRVVNAPALEGLDAFPERFFSGILMRSYLEHESQPHLVLKRAYRCLAPGGRIYIRVPDFGSLNRRIMGRRWCGFRFPDHVNYFSDRTLRALAARVGLSYSRTNWLSPFDDNIIAVLTRPA